MRNWTLCCACHCLHFAWLSQKPVLQHECSTYGSANGKRSAAAINVKGSDCNASESVEANAATTHTHIRQFNQQQWQAKLVWMPTGNFKANRSVFFWLAKVRCATYRCLLAVACKWWCRLILLPDTHKFSQKSHFYANITAHTHTHSCMPSIMATIVVCTCWPVRKIASCIDDNNDNHSFCNAALHPPSPLTSLDFAMPCRQRR